MKIRFTILTVIVSGMVFWWIGQVHGSETALLDVESAVSEALSNQSAIAAAVELEKAAVEGDKAAGAALLPRLSASYAYSRFKDAPYAVFGMNHVPIGKQDRFSWDVSAVQPLFTGFALSTRKKMAALDVDLQKVRTEQAHLDVAHQARVAWYRLVLAERAVAVAQEEVVQLDAHVQDAQRFFDQGVISYNDLLKARVGLAHARQGLVQVQAERNVAAAYLNTAIGRPVDQPVRVAGLPDTPPELPELGALLDLAQVQRPELKAMRLSFEKAGLAVQAAKAPAYPELSMIGRYERLGDNAAADHNEFGNDNNLSLSLQARWTFFEWGKTRDEVRKAAHEQAAVERQWQGVKDSVALEVVQAWETWRAAQENCNTAREARIQAVENFRITNLRFQQGAATSTDVLDARSYLSRAELDDDRAIVGVFLAEADLKRAIGQR